MKKIKIQEKLYLIGYIFLILPTFFAKVTFFQSQIQASMYLGIIILFFSFVIKYITLGKISKKFLLEIIAIFILCLISSAKSGTNDMIKLFLIIFSFPYTDYKRFLKKDIFIKFFLIILVVSLYFLGFTQSSIFLREGKIRYAFGFSQPNQIGLYITMIEIEVFYLRKDKKNNYPYVFLALLGLFFVHTFTDSRASVILMIFIIIAFILRKKIFIGNQKSKIVKYSIENIFVIMTSISILVTIFYSNNNTLMINLNKLFSSRIKWASVYYNYYTLNLFGNDLFIPYDFVKYNNIVFYCLDNAFIYFILRYGIVFWISYAYMFYKLIQKSINEKNHFLTLIIIGLIIYGLMENTILKYAYNPFLILLGLSIFKENKNKVVEI